MKLRANAEDVFVRATLEVQEALDKVAEATGVVLRCRLVLRKGKRARTEDLKGHK